MRVSPFSFQPHAKFYTPEQIINKVLEAEILLNQGNTLPVVWKKIGVSDCT